MRNRLAHAGRRFVAGSGAPRRPDTGYPANARATSSCEELAVKAPNRAAVWGGSQGRPACFVQAPCSISVAPHGKASPRCVTGRGSVAGRGPVQGGTRHRVPPQGHIRPTRSAIGVCPETVGYKPGPRYNSTVFAFQFIPPCSPMPAKAVPVGDGWPHEVEFDGYRVRVHKTGKDVAIYSRNGHVFTPRFETIAYLLRDPPARSAVIDGEIVANNRRGVPNFARLHLRSGSADGLHLWCFDLLALNVGCTRVLNEPVPRS